MIGAGLQDVGDAMNVRSLSPGTITGASACSRARTGGGALRLLLVVFVLVMTGACATKGDVRDLQEEMQEIAARQDSALAELHRSQRAAQDSLAEESRQQVEAFQRDLDRQLRDLEDELLITKEIAGQSQRRLAQLQDRLDAQPSPGTPGGVGAGAVADADREEGDPWGGAQAGDDGEEAELFDAALEALERGQYSAARFGFGEIIEESPNHDLAPRARYYLAQIMAEEADDEEGFEAAIDAFTEIAEYHPDADAVPEAYLRVGEIYLEELGAEGEAREYFERIVDSFPDSDAAELAQERLDELG